MTTHFFPCASMKFEANNPSFEFEVSAFDLLATVYQCHHHCAEISEPQHLYIFQTSFTVQGVLE